MARTRAERRHYRYAKMWRRLKADRQSHHHDVKQPEAQRCRCFLTQDARSNGRTKSFFADTPKLCSRACCGNPRRFRGRHEDRLTMQEIRAFLRDEDEE